MDNTWTTNETAPKEADPEGNVNNFLTPEQIKPSATAAILNTVTPASTTAKMAGEQPKEVPEATATPSDVPGGFPATPADELEKPLSINPLPAADGAVNPVKLEPGETIPSSIAVGSINDNVKLDKESYEKSDTIPGLQTEVPATSKNVIPESGLPIGAETINSAAPTSTTAALAGQVPLEPKVPQVVKESQEKAGADPEASAVAEEVKEKAEVEEELKEKVPEAPSTSEGTAGVGTQKTETTTPIVAAAAATGGTILAAAIAAKDTIVANVTPAANQASTAALDSANNNLPDSVKDKLPVTAQETLASQNKVEKREEVSPEVPAEVKESIVAAGESPEAAANTAAVKDKEVLEAELLKEVKPAPAADEVKSESKTEQAKPDESIAGAVKKDETPTPVSKEDEPKQSTNGTGSKPAAPASTSSKPTDAATSEKKKKNRVSAFFSKIKHKISD